MSRGTVTNSKRLSDGGQADHALDGMFGFVVPWILTLAGLQSGTAGIPVGSVAAFFGGYSVRFSTGPLERLMKALFPETKPKA